MQLEVGFSVGEGDEHLFHQTFCTFITDLGENEFIPIENLRREA
jgi:hypothetical protein